MRTRAPHLLAHLIVWATVAALRGPCEGLARHLCEPDRTIVGRTHSEVQAFADTSVSRPVLTSTSFAC